MLQEAPDDADDLNIVADARNIRAQAADAADDQRNLHAGLTCCIERLNDGAVNELIALKDDFALAGFLVFCRLALNRSNNGTAGTVRRND